MDPSGIPPNLIPDKKIIRNIPGRLPPPSPKEKDGYVDLKQMSVAALKELLQRQVGILSNRFLVKKLADGGAKLSALKAQIEEELTRRNEVDSAASLLSKMTIHQLNELEWTSNVNPGHSDKKRDDTEDDQDEQDPLHIIATHSSVYNNKKLEIRLPDESLITKADLEDCAAINEPLEQKFNVPSERSTSPAPSTSSSVLSDLEVYSANMCERFDHTKPEERFKPNRLQKPKTSVREDKVTVSKDKKKSGLWEESSAAPPPPVHGDTKMLSLQESLALQIDQTEKLKLAQTKHAAERLMTLQGIKVGREIPSSVATSMAFREKKHENDDSDAEGSASENEEHEVYDDEHLDDGPTSGVHETRCDEKYKDINPVLQTTSSDGSSQTKDTSYILHSFKQHLPKIAARQETTV